MNASDFLWVCRIVAAAVFSCARAMMKGIESGRKVGCHGGGVDLRVWIRRTVSE